MVRLSSLLSPLLATSLPSPGTSSEEYACADIECHYRLRSVGSMYSEEYALYLENEHGTPISFFHDIPLQPSENVFNMVVEIPRWQNAKMETNKETAMNPIKQDRLDSGALRYTANIFPTSGYPANYGMIPKTWEDPYVETDGTGTYGDNDPIDVLELGSEIGYVGQIKQVKILGALCLIDERETDWKLLTIDIRDPRASSMNGPDDIDTHFPGFLELVKRWFIVYKIPETGKPNTLGFGGQAVDRAVATQLVFETHGYWNALINGSIPDAKAKGIQRYTTTTAGSPYKVDASSPQVRSVPKADPQPSTKPGPGTEGWTFLPAEWSLMHTCDSS